MKYSKCKGLLRFFVIFSMFIFQETYCGPVGRVDSDVERTLLQLYVPTNSKQNVEDLTQESSHFNFVSPSNYNPFYNRKFKPSHNHDSFEFPDSREYLDQKDSLESFRKGKFVIPWLDTNSGLETADDNKNEDSQSNEQDQPASTGFGSDEDCDSDEDSGDEDLNFGSRSANQFIHKYHGYNPNPGSYGHHFGRNPGYQHSFHNHHSFGHNHGFHHEHTAECRGGDRGGRHPPRGPPPPREPPTSAPTTANPPVTAPTTAVSIDPRLSTMASIVSSEVPAIDIRFGR